MEVDLKIKCVDNGFIIEYYEEDEAVETYVISESENDFNMQLQIIEILQNISTDITSKLEINDIDIALASGKEPVKNEETEEEEKPWWLKLKKGDLILVNGNPRKFHGMIGPLNNINSVTVELENHEEHEHPWESVKGTVEPYITP